jgi:phosphate transport system permease protein
MSTSALFLLLAGLVAIGYLAGRYRSLALVGGARGIRKLHSLPHYYGLYTALWCGLPALLLLVLWGSFQEPILEHLVQASAPAEVRAAGPAQLNLYLNDMRNLLYGNITAEQAAPGVAVTAARYKELRSIARMALTVLVLSLAIGCMLFARARVHPEQRARNSVERVFERALLACSTLAVFITIGIFLSVLYESLHFFRSVSPLELLFGTTWSPQTAMRADQVGSSGAFGAVPLFVGTAMISGIAMLIAVPVGLFSAIYLAEYASPRFRTWAKPLLEVLAGIPTVVYGFFAALTIGPALRGLGQSLGLDVASESALAAGLVMGLMIIPFVSSLADDMITAVPQSLRDGAYALGATRSETIRQVVMRAALPGIVGGVLLAISRAIGETMIVVMAAGLAAKMTANPLEAVTTVTVQIVTLLTGDQEFDSPKTLAAFALGLVLFLITLTLNFVALHVVRKYREQYE